MSHIHVPDGVLPWWLWLPGLVAALALVVICARIAERTDARRRVPLLAVVASLMLVAMSSEIVPVAYHMNLTVVAGVLLGPLLSVIAAFIVQLVLAMLGHGGITVVGLNTLLTASEMVIGWALFGVFTAVFSRRRVGWAAAVATVATLAITTTMLVALVAVAGVGALATHDTGALNPASLTLENPFSGGVVHIGLFSGGKEASAAGNTAAPPSIRRFAIIVYGLGSIGWVLEAIVSAWILSYIARVRPGLIWEGAARPREVSVPKHEAGVRP
jgi:cobalt/nickel transport system permease protein